MSARPLAVLLAAATAAAIPAGSARASPADAFENKVPPISGQLYGKAGRFELTPTANLSAQDAFFSKYLFGAKLGYHFSDEWSLHGTFAAGFASDTSSTSVCPVNQGCRAASPEQLYQVPGHVTMMAGGEIAFSPIYGKLNVLGEKTVHFDLSAMAGADYVSFRDVLKPADANAGVVPAKKGTVGGHVGLGARIFLTEYLALRLEVKDYLYSVPSLAQGKLQSQLFAELGLSIFLPLSKRAGP
jgi:outer membrane beta-barrel protein